MLIDMSTNTTQRPSSAQHDQPLYRVLSNGLLVTLDFEARRRGTYTFLTCDWLVEIPSGNPEPDSWADTVSQVPCGARVASLDGSDDLQHTTCLNGHTHHPYGSPEWEAEMAEWERGQRF